ncbi:MAG TPA: hypothetical protein DC060_17685 [Gemmatimonadetes bacterium]|jgi:hypothetical protein|nr:hypothetical protein [Gemmatimonadota bacterium]HBE00015.1 hypothetical protein [Gemmatimonadota bacterium]|tara:strand:- start:90 stop:413 length:324 start_codon:yes stop_codon:yes gene_type:complete
MVEVFICSVLHAIGQEDEAVGVVADLVARSREEHISGYVLASALLLTGDEPRALDHLEQALQDRDPFLPGPGGVPRFRALYGEPRFCVVFQAVFPGRELRGAAEGTG